MKSEAGLRRYWLALVLAAASLFIISAIGWSEMDFFTSSMLNVGQRPSLLLTAYFLAVLSYLFVCWGPIRISRRHLKWLIVLYVFAWLAWPAQSLDVAAYLIGAKNTAVFGLNQMRDAYAAAAGNPWLHYLDGIAWRVLPSPYGPFFWLIVWPLGYFKSVVVATYAYKIISFLVGWWLIKLWWDEAKVIFSADERDDRLVLLLLNPVLWLYGFTEAHNEIIWIALLLWGVRSLRQRRIGRTAASFMSALLLKMTSVLAWPIYLRAYKINRARSVVWLVGVGLFGLLLVALIGHTPASLLASYSNMHNSCISLCSPLVMALVWVRIPQLLVAAGLIVWLIWWFVVKNDAPYDYLFWSYAVLFLIATTWLAPWYFLALVIFGSLSKRMDWRWFSLLLVLFSIWIQVAIILQNVIQNLR